MTRPPLCRIPLAAAQVLAGRVGVELIVALRPGEWTPVHGAAYDAGSIRIELDRRERPIAAYRRDGAGQAVAS